MASIKISELNELTNVDDADVLPIVDSSANETKKITANNFLNKNIEVLTGTLSPGASSSSYGSATNNYPTGYNKNNCVVISYMIQPSGGTNPSNWITGSTIDVVQAPSGSFPTRIQLTDSNIMITANYNSTETGPSPFPTVLTYNYKIVLMKIS